jgi:hypothetical protein
MRFAVIRGEQCAWPIGIRGQTQQRRLVHAKQMWAAVVDRAGIFCGVTRSDPNAWPGSRDIAIAKANGAHLMLPMRF